MKRRLFLTGLAALIAAPAIIRVAQLMPISVPKLIIPEQQQLILQAMDAFIWYDGFDPIGYDDSTGLFEFPEGVNWDGVKVTMSGDPEPYWRNPDYKP